MPRPVNYDEKIAVLETKIAKKKEDIRKLKEQLVRFRKKKASEGSQQLQEFMKRNNLSAKEVLERIQG